MCNRTFQYDQTHSFANNPILTQPQDVVNHVSSTTPLPHLCEHVTASRHQRFQRELGVHRSSPKLSYDRCARTRGARNRTDAQKSFSEWHFGDPPEQLVEEHQSRTISNCCFILNINESGEKRPNPIKPKTQPHFGVFVQSGSVLAVRHHKSTMKESNPMFFATPHKSVSDLMFPAKVNSPAASSVSSFTHVPFRTPSCQHQHESATLWTSRRTSAPRRCRRRPAPRPSRSTGSHIAESLLLSAGWT